ncbi:MAG: hypothetical protein IT373_37745 [Polyangiaceae bacterium]|nr:hypothetical protein [Polyangiaceae bacterium]
MFRAHKIALAFLTSLSLGVLAAPALAGDPTDDDKPIVDDEKPRFPMSAAEFQKHVEQRLEKALARGERVLERRNVPAGIAQKVRAVAAQIAENVRAATREATADGSVTKEEAKHVREVAREGMKAAREQVKQYLPKKGEKGEKGDGPGKGAGRGRGKAKGPKNAE